MGPAAVLCQRGQSVWVHTIGDIKKVVTCRVKPFQLIDRESIKDSNSKKVMLEDGLEDVKNLLDQEDLEGDTIGVKYLMMANTASFLEMSTYTIIFPVSQHGTSEVNAAKRNEIRNLKDLIPSRKFEMKVKKE